uniref:Putative membrane protein n=1 Tax=biofilter metagenome TaxID=1070537 RepID=A0A193SBL9_9ZZZZ
MFKLNPTTVLCGYLAIAALTVIASIPLNKDCRNPEYGGRMLGACLLTEGMGSGAAWPIFWAWEAEDLAKALLFSLRKTASD